MLHSMYLQNNSKTETTFKSDHKYLGKSTKTADNLCSVVVISSGSGLAGFLTKTA